MQGEENQALGKLFAALPSARDAEQFNDLLRAPGVRIERIVSQGQASPATGWYDQDEHEWVCVLRGAARLEFDDGDVRELVVGDYVHIAAHRRHRVAWTDPDAPTVWLAVFYH